MRRTFTTTLAVTVIAAGGTAAMASATIPKPWKNCKAVNARYPHGIGRVGARDKTAGTPVTTFKRSNKLYALAIHYNAGLDRDHDGIACEAA